MNGNILESEPRQLPSFNRRVEDSFTHAVDIVLNESTDVLKTKPDINPERQLVFHARLPSDNPQGKLPFVELVFDPKKQEVTKMYLFNKRNLPTQYMLLTKQSAGLWQLRSNSWQNRVYIDCSRAFHNNSVCIVSQTIDFPSDRLGKLPIDPHLIVSGGYNVDGSLRTIRFVLMQKSLDIAAEYDFKTNTNIIYYDRGARNVWFPLAQDGLEGQFNNNLIDISSLKTTFDETTIRLVFTSRARQRKVRVVDFVNKIDVTGLLNKAAQCLPLISN